MGHVRYIGCILDKASHIEENFSDFLLNYGSR